MMATLTRRRIPDTPNEVWRVCGFYPGLDPRQHLGGSAATFKAARAAFEEAWRRLLPEIPEGAFHEYRRHRSGKAEITAARERGEKPPSELPNAISRLVCGVQFYSHRPHESLPHLEHIYAAQTADGNHRR